MGLTASLDIGAEKMVMALGNVEHDACRLIGIKILASQGMERGKMKDKEKVRACVRSLVTELVKEHQVETMNIGLSGDVLQIREHRVTISLQKRMVEQADLYRAEQRCREGLANGSLELVDLIPVAYCVDRSEMMANPLGKTGHSLEVVYQAYQADYDYLTEMRHLLDGCNVGNIVFYPVARAYSEALDVASADDFALVDFGAMGMNVLLFKEGMLEYEARLSLGVRSIDSDIMLAFGINSGQARKLKHEHGQALRSACKNKKVQIPDTKLTLDSRDLATVVQSRAEELLEGVVCLLQNWGFDNLENEIVMTGGGSRLEDLDVLLNRLSGHPVVRAVAKRIQTSREEVLRTPEYLVALGLLMCEQPEMEEPRFDFREKLVNGLKGLFGR